MQPNTTSLEAPAESGTRSGVPMADTERRTLVYLAGAGHSGSTLMSFILNTHPEMFSIGEMHAPRYPEQRPAERMCSCGSTMVECGFFRDVQRRFRELGHEFDATSWDLQFRISANPWIHRLTAGSLRSNALESMRNALFRINPAYRRGRKILEERNALFVRAALDTLGKRIFVDGTKDPIRIAFLRKLQGIDLRVIHLVRDPRAYAYSRYRDVKYDMARASASWLTTNRNVERQLRTLPAGSWTRLRYEDLCLDTSKALEALRAFLGLENLEAPEDYHRAEHHIMGNKMRLKRDGPASIRMDDVWRRKLAPGQIAEVERRCGRLMALYGYRTFSPADS